MFVLNSIFVGGLDLYIEFFSQKLKSKLETLPQFISPFIGILKNVYEAVNEFGVKDNARYDNLEDIFLKTSSFDSLLFTKLRDVVRNELPPANLEEKQVFIQFDQMIEEIEMLSQSNKLRKSRAVS